MVASKSPIALKSPIASKGRTAALGAIALVLVLGALAPKPGAQEAARAARAEAGDE